MQLSAESTELVELRELREDVERRERAQAAVIENQAKRLDELETLYRVRMLARGVGAALKPCQNLSKRPSSLPHCYLFPPGTVVVWMPSATPLGTLHMQ